MVAKRAQIVQDAVKIFWCDEDVRVTQELDPFGSIVSITRS